VKWDNEKRAWLDGLNEATSRGRIVVATDILERARDALREEFGVYAGHVTMCALRHAIKQSQGGHPQIPLTLIAPMLLAVFECWFNEVPDEENLMVLSRPWSADSEH
jgi:hypothetical protein